MLVRNYWIILALIVFIKLIKGKELSSYNIKWLVSYTIYIAWLHAEGEYNFSSKYIDEEIESYIFTAFLFPLACYLLFPFVWKFLCRWNLFQRIEDKIDKWYDVIKNLC